MNKLRGALPMLVWGVPLLLFAGPTELLMLASAVLLHEGGHVFAFALLGEPSPGLSAVALGLTLDPRRPLPYRREAIIALFGPLFNLLLALPLLLWHGAAPSLRALGAVHFFSALANLAPLGGNDGDLLLFDLSALLFPLHVAEAIRRTARLLTALLLLFFALRLLLFPGGGAALFLLSSLLFRALPPKSGTK